MLIAIVCLVALTLPAAAENWPAWRGTDGNGICREQSLPLHWSTNQNVRWRVPLPGPGNSTPIIWGERVFITQAIAKERQRLVMSFDRRDGKLLWQAGTVATVKDSGGAANPPCSPSPVTDGERVVAWFGSAGVFCFDLSGHELWRRDLGRQTHGWGYAASPVLYRNLCLLNFGPGQRSFLIALDKRTGETVWQYDLPPIAADAKWEDFGGDLKDWKRLGSPTMPEVTGSCATPVVVHTTGRDEVVVALPLRVMAFAPTDRRTVVELRRLEHRRLQLALLRRRYVRSNRQRPAQCRHGHSPRWSRRCHGYAPALAFVATRQPNMHRLGCNLPGPHLPGYHDGFCPMPRVANRPRPCGRNGLPAAERATPPGRRRSWPVTASMCPTRTRMCSCCAPIQNMRVWPPTRLAASR